MTPVCAECNTEMLRQGPTVNLAYDHNHAPTDFSKAIHYQCPGCQHSVYQPLGYSFGMASGVPHGTVIHIAPVQPASPKGKLP